MRAAAAIPALEAAATVGDVVVQARAVLGDVVVVDDGSKDRTADTARRAGARVLTHPRTLGKGAALRTALNDVFDRGYEAVVTLDADGQHLPEQIPLLVEAAQRGADLVIGCRYAAFREMSTVRRCSNLVSSWWISWLCGARLEDAQCGFRVYKRALYEAVGLPELHYDAESAVIVRAARSGFRIAAVPIQLGFVDGRATSHYRPLLDSWRIARAVLRARYEPRAIAAVPKVPNP